MTAAHRLALRRVALALVYLSPRQALWFSSLAYAFARLVRALRGRPWKA